MGHDYRLFIHATERDAGCVRLALYAPLFERDETNSGSNESAARIIPGQLAERFGAYRLILAYRHDLARWNDDLHGADPAGVS